MKLDEYIKALQRIQENYGNLELIYAKDDEGNGYNRVGYLPERVYYNNIVKELISEVDIEDYQEDEYSVVCCVN